MAKRVFSCTFFATSRAEAFVGRGPSDTVSYAKVETGLDIGDYTFGIFANLASGAGTFGWAQGDRYRGVENLTGSQHTDRIIGNNNANILDGGGSPDFIYGRDGRDNILGGGGFDFLYGGEGNDVMNGQQQTDTMYGNDGHDQMWGGSNFVRRVFPGTNYADVLYGGAGNDRLHGDVRLPINNAPSE